MKSITILGIALASLVIAGVATATLTMPNRSDSSPYAGGFYEDVSYSTTAPLLCHEISVEDDAGLSAHPKWTIMRMERLRDHDDEIKRWVTLVSEPDKQGRVGMIPCVVVELDFLPKEVRYDTTKRKLVPID